MFTWLCRLGLMAGFATLSAAPAQAVDLSLSQGRIVMSGVLYGDRDFDQLQAFVKAHPEARTVLMRNFFGGINMSTFIGVASFIRERGLATEVSGACISACAIAFLGGVTRRTAADAKPQATFVAFHGISQRGNLAEEWRLTFTNALKRLTGGRMSDVVATQSFEVFDSGYIAFYDGRRYKRPDGTSVFRCVGTERKKTHDCPGMKGVDAHVQGVYTR